MARHLQDGKKGEQAAADFLRQRGYDFVAANHRQGRAEIDLIVAKTGLLVFVEVKTRSNLSFGFPESFVSPRKVQLLTAAADAYVHATDWQGNIRFDIVAVTLTPTGLHIEHFEDAFW